MIQIVYTFLEISVLFIISMCCVSSELVTDNWTTVTEKNVQNIKLEEIENLIERNHVPNEALNGVYSECILGLSFACLQRKLIAFLFELDQMTRINLLGDVVMVIRKNNDLVSSVESARIVQYANQTQLEEMIDNLVDTFFDNHFLRVKIPRYLEDSEATVSRGENLIYLDIDFNAKRQISEREDRKHCENEKKSEESERDRRRRRRRHRRRRRRRRRRRHRGKYKVVKKVVMAVGLMTCMKAAMLAPVFFGMVGLKAMKALVMSVMALTIQKMMYMQKFDMKGFLSSASAALTSGGGHGSDWDRNINVAPSTASTTSLPYYIEPPTPRSSQIASV